MTDTFPLYVDPELKKLIEGLIRRGESRNDAIHRLLATHPEVNRPDLASVPKKRRGNIGSPEPVAAD